MNEYQIGYLAGLVDGEGTITFCKSRGTFFPSISIGVIDKSVIDNLHSWLGFGHIYITDLPSGKSIYRIYWRKQIEVMKVLNLIMPHLIIKQEQAKQVLSWVQSRKVGIYKGDPLSEWELSLCNLVRELNGGI